MKVGDYVRTKYGIKQIYEIDNNKTVWKYKYKLKKQDGDGCIDLGCFSDNDVIKSSPSIIDLIEVGDYVNGIKITSVYDDDKEANDYNLKHKKCLGTNVYDEDYQEKLIYEEDIKSIVTKEQFESMEYRIGE